MNVVTGGLGFIGNELVRQLLNAGEEVTVIDNRNRVAPDIEDLNGIRVVEQDISDYNSLGKIMLEIKPAKVFHLAAIHFIPECNSDPERTIRINVEGTSSVLRATAEAGCTKFVFASSGAVYADSPFPLTENSPIAPVDIYGWTKLFGEKLCLLNNEIYKMPIVICRLFNNYGPRETNLHIIPEILKQLKEGDTIRLGNTSPIRDYINTTDCASAIIKLSEITNNGVTISNVATGMGYSVRDIIEQIAGITGRKIKVETDPSRFRKADKQIQVSDISFLKSVGWQPSFSLVEGMTSLLKYERFI